MLFSNFIWKGGITVKRLFLLFLVFLIGTYGGCNCISSPEPTHPQSYQIVGTVVAKYTDVAIDNASVVLQGGNTSFETVTDKDGNFFFNNIPVGEYTIIVHRNLYLPTQTEIYVENSDIINPPPISVRIEMEIALRGKLYFESGYLFCWEINTPNVKKFEVSSMFTHAVSPDGTKIAFASFRGGFGAQGDICVMDSDGSNIIYLTDNYPYLDERSPKFSPDGSKIVYEGSGPLANGIDIYCTDLQGNVVRLTDWNGAEYSPCFSPDGTKIAFYRYLGGEGYSVWIMNADGSDPRKVIDLGPSFYLYPDGNNCDWQNGMLLLNAETTDLGIYLVNEDGSNLRLVTRGRHASFAFNGSKIIYDDYDETWHHNIYIINPDGTDKTEILAAQYSFQNWSNGLYIPTVVP